MRYPKKVSYLVKLFNTNHHKNGSSKCNEFYKMLGMIYNTYPSLIKELVDYIMEWGNPRDFLLIIAFSDNKELNDYVYQKVLEIIHNDLEILEKNDDTPISTMGKYLPRNKTFINTETNFQDTFTMLMWPTAKRITKYDKVKLSKKYRKLKSKLVNRLDIIETYIEQNKLEDIDFKGKSYFSIKKYMSKLITNEVCKNKLIRYFNEKYSTFHLSHIINMLLNNNLTTFEIDCINNYYNNNKRRFTRDLLNDMPFTRIEKCTILIDISKYLYDKKLMAVAISIALCFYENNCIIMATQNNGSTKLDLERKTLYDMVYYFQEFVGEYPIVPPETYHRLFVISEKFIDTNNIDVHGYFKLDATKIIIYYRRHRYNINNGIYSYPCPIKKKNNFRFNIFHNIIKQSNDMEKYFATEKENIKIRKEKENTFKLTICILIFLITVSIMIPFFYFI